MLRSPANQYALKLWLGLSAAMAGAVVFVWQSPGGVEGQRQRALDWPPMFFYITAVIALQPNVRPRRLGWRASTSRVLFQTPNAGPTLPPWTPVQVEGTVARAVMRVAGIFLGALVGLAAASSAALLHHPAYLTCMVGLFSALLGVPAADPQLRYTACMVLYTAASLMTCTYIDGCCSAATWQTFAGKVRGAAVGLCVPHHTLPSHAVAQPPASCPRRLCPPRWARCGRCC